MSEQEMILNNIKEINSKVGEIFTTLNEHSVSLARFDERSKAGCQPMQTLKTEVDAKINKMGKYVKGVAAFGVALGAALMWAADKVGISIGG